MKNRFHLKRDVQDFKATNVITFEAPTFNSVSCARLIIVRKYQSKLKKQKEEERKE
jgi:hypothetical protein